MSSQLERHDGQFALKGAMTDEHFSTDLGVQYDNFVSYVCFNSKADITAKIEREVNLNK